MAIDNDLTDERPIPINSASSSSFLPITNRKRFVQVATENSATFIEFPKNLRHAFPFIPISRPRTSHSSTRLSYNTVDTQSLSNQSKTSTNAPSSSIASGEHQQPINPILNNPLLNHRREEIKSPPKKTSSSSYTRTTRLCLSSKPLKTTSNDTHITNIRASTAPPLAHQKETNTNISDRLINSNIDEEQQQQQQTQYIDDNKYDYITRWLNEVRAATYSNETFLSKNKQRTKRRYVTS